jgi:hypothetical protein
MALAEVPFDLVEVKLAGPSARPGTVAQADAIARLAQRRQDGGGFDLPQARCLVAQ